MSNISTMITDRTITFYIGGQPYQIDRDSAVYPQVRAELAKANPDPQTLVDLADTVRVVSQQLAAAQRNAKTANYLPKGVISVTRNGVTYDGEVLQNALADRLMDILSQGFKIGPWIRFAENLYMNPAEHAREEMLLWLEKADLPITEDGCFLAYKRVRSDYRDIHSGTFDNSVGQVVQLEGRDKVDPNRDNVCSRGLHFCSKDYLPNFGNSSGNRVVLLKINPADVVSIPSDYQNTKGRTWRYEVVDEVEVDGITNKVWEPISSDYNDADDEYDEYDDDYDPDFEDDFDDEDDEPVVQDKTAAVKVERDRLLNNYGIVNLRRMASSAGLNSTLAWKVYSKDQLAQFLAEQNV